MTNETETKKLVVEEKDKLSLVKLFAQNYGLEAENLLATLKATAFKQANNIVITNEQMCALLVVANEYHLNPFTREIYAFPDKNQGIVPVVGVDGWSKIINSHPEFDGMQFRSSEKNKRIDDDHKECPEWMEVTMYHKHREHPI
jgi:hypothetical protein